MQKYKLVYETETEEVVIPIKVKDETYEGEVEICFIDKITTIFENEKELLNQLCENNLISSNNGKLHIKRPNGKVDAMGIIYDDNKFREVSYNAIQQFKKSGSLKLKKTTEVDGCIGVTIRFFIEDERALDILNKTFCYKNDIKELVKNLNGYLSYKDKTILEVWEVSDREKFRNNLYSQLRNYNLLRELIVWIHEYKKGGKKIKYSSTWQNPYEKFEMEKEEREERNNSL